MLLTELLTYQRRLDRAQVERAYRDFCALVDLDELRKRRARRLAIQSILRGVAEGVEDNDGVQV